MVDHSPSRKLTDQVAIITGGASGIGRAVARLFAAEGARVAIIDQDAAGAAAVRSEIDALGGDVRINHGDVCDAALAESVVRQVAAQWGAVDILVTCAAVSVGKVLGDTTPEEWDRVFAVNVTGTFLWIRAVLSGMVARRHGSIVTVGSQIALAGGRGSASYAATKGAIISLTRSVALDYANFGIRANVLIPGAIDTPFLERSFARQADPVAARQRSIDRHVMGRFGTVEECARAVLFLASDDASFTTGALLPVDGGWLVA